MELDAKLEANARIEERLEEAKAAKGSGGKFSKAEWDAARKKHAEKMKAMQ